MSNQSSTVTLSVQGLSKRFTGTIALDEVSFDLHQGEFVALLGPNGSGKSTLIKILAGIHASDAGTLRFRGEKVANLTQLDSVGFVHQDLGIIDTLTVAENLRLGLPPVPLLGPVMNRRREYEAARIALERVTLDVPMDLEAGYLTAGEKALLAVARLLHGGAKLLVVDEATSTLPPSECIRFMDLLKQETRSGATVIFVSHKLSEVVYAADRALVLLDGRLTTDQAVSSASALELTEILIGHQDRGKREVGRIGDHVIGKEVVRLEGAASGPLSSVDLVVRAGEAVGVGGLVGSGLHDIGLMAHGLLAPQRGCVRRAPGTRSALVPPQRETQGNFATLTVRENIAIAALRGWRSRAGLLRGRDERVATDALIRSLSVKPADGEAVQGNLSGGNQQKAIFARAVIQNPNLYVLCEPTRGVDIATRREIYELVDRLKRSGAAVLVVSSDAEDLYAICERVGVLRDGTIAETTERVDMTIDSLAEMI